MGLSKNASKKKIHEFISNIEKHIFCHAPKCRRKYPYLRKWGYVGNALTDSTYCMDHQHLLTK